MFVEMDKETGKIIKNELREEQNNEKYRRKLVAHSRRKKGRTSTYTYSNVRAKQIDKC